MHAIQQKILALLKDQGSTALRYREIGRRIGEKYPQTVKHHIETLKEKSLIIEQNGFLKLNTKSTSNKSFLNLPFYGLANCGEATIYAEDKADGFIRISRNILPDKSVKKFFILRASGNSMNQANVGPKRQSIDDGDFIIIDSQKRDPKDGDYIVSVIENCANIKKFRYDEGLHRVQLLSESTDEYFPIVMHESDNYHVMGTVVDVIKNL